MSFPTAARVSILFAVLAGGAVLVPGCGGDTIGDTFFGPDGSVGMDATMVVDTGAPDTSMINPPPDSGPSCTNGQSLCGAVCVDETSDGTNCGGCGNTCAAGQMCNMGTCASSCSSALVQCGSSCIDTQGDAKNCGGCGVACATGLVCTGGMCALTCETGETMCTSGGAPIVSDGGIGDAGDADAGDADAATATDGGMTPVVSYCIDAHSDRNNCGGCGIQCTAGQVCSGGVCSLTCAPGFVICNGTCVDPSSSRSYCGATAGCGVMDGDAGTDAAVDGGSSAGSVCGSGQVCSMGTCQATCGTGLVNCNGVCVDPRSNPNYCGATPGCGVGAGGAGTICTVGQVCAGNGVCQTSCGVDQVQCGNECIDPSNSNVACGATGNCTNVGVGNSAGKVCPGGQVCSSGSCAASCATGEALCGGVCVNGQTDSTRCGAAGNCSNVGMGNSAGTACATGLVCTGGSCSITCQANQVLCGSTCIDPTTNLTFCGANGNCTNDGVGMDTKGLPCPMGQVCSNKTCQTQCTGVLTACGDVCVNESTDNQNCGACGNICPGGTVCVGKTCTAICTGTLKVCNNACVDEQDDPGHCGSCTPCTVEAQVSATDCRSGSCAIGLCKTGFADCNGTYTDGCEVNKQTDAKNCGGCGNVCATNQNCSAGTCAYSTSCATYLAANPGAADGVYTIKPTGVATPFQVYCDMTRDSGGWTLILKAAGVDADTTFAYANAIWTNTTLLNSTDLTVASGDAKYQSYVSVPFNTIRGEIGINDGKPVDNFRFQYTVTATSAMALFAGPTNFVNGYPVSPPQPPFSTQPNCQVYGINLLNGAASARFGWSANQENDCLSNDTAAGFAPHYGSGDHGAGYTCESTNCSQGDEFIAVDGLMWVK